MNKIHKQNSFFSLQKLTCNTQQLRLPNIFGCQDFLSVATYLFLAMPCQNITFRTFLDISTLIIWGMHIL